MRAAEFIREEEKLDEILPLIGLAARGIAGGAAKMAGKAALKGVGALAKGAARTVGKTAGAAINAFGSDDEDDQGAIDKNDPNAKVGTQTQPQPQPSAGSNKPVDPTNNPAVDFRPGAKINLPSTTGKVGNFKITKVTGDQVEIENPDKFKVPGEPDKLTFTRDELQSLMGGAR
jgi:hypothetical protein